MADVLAPMEGDQRGRFLLVGHFFYKQLRKKIQKNEGTKVEIRQMGMILGMEDIYIYMHRHVSYRIVSLRNSIFSL